MSPRSLVVALVLVVASLTVGYGLGRRQSAPVVAPSDAPTETKPPPTGVHVERLKAAENLFSMAGLKAVVLRYRGGPVDFWIEREVDGKTVKINNRLLMFDLANDLPGASKAPADSVESGYFVWTRREAWDDVSEHWRVAQSCEMISGTSSVLRTGIPLGEITLTRSDERGDERIGSTGFTLSLWKPYPPARCIPSALIATLAVQPGASTPYLVALLLQQSQDEIQKLRTGTVPVNSTQFTLNNPLPVDQPVKLIRMDETRRLSPWREQRQVFRVMARVLPKDR